MTKKGGKVIYKAEPFREGALGIFGDAKGMLIRQWNFPSVCLESEGVQQNSHNGFIDKRSRDCFMEYLGALLNSGKESEIIQWFRSSSEEDIMKFIVELFMLEEIREHLTGFRVMVSVVKKGRSFWIFQLFSKDPESNTEVYSKDDAPNVLSEKRSKKYLDQFVGK